MAVVIGFGSIVFVATSKDDVHRVADISSNVQYCTSDDKGQSMDIYRPKNVGNSKLPMIVYIHGGGWRRGDKNNILIRTYVPLFMQKNIMVASLNYRLSTKSPYPDQNDDIGCALTYLDTNADSLHIDKSKIIYFGDSAGGQLSAFAALNVPYKNYDYEAPVGVIDFYGVSDFTSIIGGAKPDANARWYLGSKYNKYISAASPATYVTKNAPRFLFLHGTYDRVVPISQSQGFYALLTKDAVDAEYITIPGVGHGFIGPELSTAKYKVITDNMNLFIKETIGR
ncbi:MAG: Carboxylesterase type [Candidatus Saccharibacteria bacterium]|nr:Carboxylesterase type [Candidatus Saccharibacteria bacterium]